MNIKSRLKSVENKLIKSNSGYCTCYGADSKYEARFDRNAPGFISRMPDICDKCRKPVDKSAIEVTFEQHQENARKRLAQAEATRNMFEG